MSKLIKTILFIVAFLSLNCIAESLDPSKAIFQYGHQIWQSEQGLPQNSIMALLQTRNGYLWIGTQGGLARFDGVRFTVYDIKNSQLKNNDILDLAEDRDGSLWIGTYGGGLSHLKNGTITNYGVNEGLSIATIRCLLYDRSGNLWIGTRGGGLNLFANGKLRTFTASDGLASNSIYCLNETVEGVWIGTDRGLSVFRNGQFKTFTTEDGLAHNIIRSLTSDKSGNLWIGTDSGLTHRNGGRFKTYTTSEGLSNATVRVVLLDRHGSLWIGTDRGLNRFRNGNFEWFTSAEALSHDSVNSLFEDHEGSLWVGTDGGGLNQLKDVNFTNAFVKENRDNTVYSVLQDRKNTLWMGTRTNGLISCDDADQKACEAGQGNLKVPVFGMHEDRDGTLWIGTRGSGITLYKNGAFYRFPENAQLSDPTVRTILNDSNGNIWVGTNEGLNRWKDGANSIFTKKDGLTDNFIYCSLEDRKGNIWFGTFTGLTLYNNGKFTALPENGILSTQSIWALHEDIEGTLWIATYGAGLFRYKDGKFTSFNSRHGMFDDAILGILEDDQGSLWLSCYRGVFRVSKKDLDDFEKGKIKFIHSEAFDSSDGMRSTECIGGVQPSGWKTKDGKLHFPTSKGLTTIDPKKVQRNITAPPVHIEQLIGNEKTIAPFSQMKTPISFAPGSGNLEFHFTGLSLVAPSKVKFRYRLDGYDKSWIDAGNRRAAFYTKIPPGNYTFRVKASNNDEVWNEAGTSISFSLEPHFYQTWYFYSLCSIALVALVFGGHRLRVRQIRKQFSAVLEERNRISREIHDTLTQDFTGVVLQLEAAEISMKENPSSTQECIEKAREIARNGLTESRRFVRALRPEILERNKLSAALSRMASRTSSSSSIQANVTVSGIERQLPQEMEDNLLRIAQEALTNSVKHSGANQSHIHLSYGLFKVVLKIQDNGTGFDSDQLSPTSDNGFGLIGMKERASSIRGTFEVLSEKGKGTRIHVSVPLYSRTR